MKKKFFFLSSSLIIMNLASCNSDNMLDNSTSVKTQKVENQISNTNRSINSQAIITPHTKPALFQKVNGFSDDFGGNTLNSSKWKACNDAFCTFDFNKSNVKVKGNNLKLTMRYNNHKPNANSQQLYFQSGKIMSTKKMCYGYYEAKIQGAPVYNGTCPAFWLYTIPSENKNTVPQVKNTISYNEIDIIELQQVPRDYKIMSCNYHIMVLKPNPKTGTNQPKFVNEFLHPSNLMGNNEYKETWNSWENYHTYACENRPDSIIWYIDNKQVAAIPNYFWHMDMYVTFSMGLRKPYEKYVNGERLTVPTTAKQARDAGFPTTMKIDYIHVWKRKNYSSFHSLKKAYKPSDF